MPISAIESVTTVQMFTIKLTILRYTCGMAIDQAVTEAWLTDPDARQGSDLLILRRQPQNRCLIRSLETEAVLRLCPETVSCHCQPGSNISRWRLQTTEPKQGGLIKQEYICDHCNGLLTCWVDNALFSDEALFGFHYFSFFWPPAPIYLSFSS